MFLSLGDYLTHTGLRLNVGQSNDLPLTNSVGSPRRQQGPSLCLIHCSAEEALLSGPLEHEQMFVTTEEQNNIWNS